MCFSLCFALLTFVFSHTRGIVQKALAQKTTLDWKKRDKAREREREREREGERERERVRPQVQNCVVHRN